MSDARRQETSPSPSPSQPIVIRENIDSLSASLSDQIEMLAGELRSRWKCGKRIGIEELGSAVEQVSKNEEQLLDLIYHEVLIREEFGEQPRLEDFATRFPQHVERLQRLFAVHGAIEDDGWEDELDSAFADQAGTVMTDDSEARRDPSSTDFGDSGPPKKVHWPRKSRDSRPVDPPPGYELLEEIGRGGMAVVYRARQQILNRIVALKMLLAGGVASKEVLARIQQEAQAVAQLQHPGIVQIHEVGEHRGLPFLSLEYVAGGTLHEWLDGRPLPPLEAVRVIEQLARTTQFAHERGVVHRDLKPANVLLTERPSSLQSSATIPIPDSDHSLTRRAGGAEPTPTFLAQTKISDFGLARVLGSRSDLTATGQVIGTPSYMAPEQAAGTVDDVSPAQDIYSLGAIFYELLTGRPPFRGSSLFDTLEQVRTTEAVPPRDLQPRVPRDVETICLKCLEKAPERRYSTAAALAEDLRRVQQGETITARPAGSFERGWKWVRRYPAIASLASLAVLLTIVGVVGILREAQRANISEKAALIYSQGAEHQRRVAEAEQQKAERSAQIAQQERVNAERQTQLALQAQAQAEASFERTMKTINSLALLGSSLRNEPGQQVVSKRLLDDTMRLYDELVKEQGDNRSVRRQRIIALTNAGEIRSSLRDTEQAEKLLKQAEELIEAEIQANPSDLDWHQQSTTVFWSLGVLYKDSERPKESLAAFRRYIVASDFLVKQSPENTAFFVGKANALVNACVALKQLGQPLEALTTYEEAISILRAQREKSPNNFGTLNELGLALHDYSSLLRALGRREPAEATFREAFEIRRDLFQKNPKFGNTRTFLARMYVSQGYYDREAGKHDSSIAQFQQAVDLLQPQADAFPDLYEHQRDLIAAMTAQLTSCFLANNAEIGKPLWKRLATRFQTALPKFTKDKFVVGAATDWLFPWSDQLWEDDLKPEAGLYAKVAQEMSLLMLTLSQPMSPQEEAGLSNNAAWRLTVVAMPQLRNHKRSVELARRAVELAPDNANYVHTLGTALYFAGDFAAAREQLLKSIQLEQEADKRGTLESLAEALKKLPKDTDAARKEISTTLGLEKRGPHSLALHYSLLAMTQWKLGEKDEARNTLRLVVDPPAGFSRSGAESRRMIAEARTLIRPE